MKVLKIMWAKHKSLPHIKKAMDGWVGYECIVWQYCGQLPSEYGPEVDSVSSLVGR